MNQEAHLHPVQESVRPLHATGAHRQNPRRLHQAETIIIPDAHLRPHPIRQGAVSVVQEIQEVAILQDDLEEEDEVEAATEAKD